MWRQRWRENNEVEEDGVNEDVYMETGEAVQVGGRGYEHRQKREREALWNNVSGLYRTPASSWVLLSLQEFPSEKGAAKEAVHKLHVTWPTCPCTTTLRKTKQLLYTSGSIVWVFAHFNGKLYRIFKRS